MDIVLEEHIRRHYIIRTRSTASYHNFAGKSRGKRDEGAFCIFKR